MVTPALQYLNQFLMWWELELTQFLCPVMDPLNALILRETVIRKLAFLLTRFSLLPFGTYRILNWKIIIYDRDSSTSSVAVNEMSPHILVASIYHHSVTTWFWESGFPRIRFIACMGVHYDLGYQFGFINLICWWPTLTFWCRESSAYCKC